MIKRSSLAATLLLPMVLSGCSQQGSTTDDESAVGANAVVAVRVGIVTEHRFLDAVAASGAWRSSGDVVIAAPFAGTVESLEPRVGDAVAQGQHLGALLTRESKATLRGAELLAAQAGSPAEKEEASRALALARRDMVRVPLIAPRAGIVTHRAAEVGADVAEGSEMLTLTPRTALVCEAHVPAAIASRVHAGQRATLQEEGVGGNRVAHVQRVLPLVGAGDQTRLVWLTPEGGGPPPALDRFVAATIELDVPRLALAVPDSAVVEDDLTGLTRVAVVGADSTATWTTVTLGTRADGWDELTRSDLKLGARVVVVGQRGLPDHARVKALK